MKIMIRLQLILIFYGEDGSRELLTLKLMLVCGNIISIGFYSMEIIELLQLGKIEKESVSSHGKYNSLS